MKVWTNGCFDVLHRGHIELFKYAKSLGKELIVGVDTDEKVKKDKGKNRPINCLNDRIEIRVRKSLVGDDDKAKKKIKTRDNNRLVNNRTR